MDIWIAWFEWMLHLGQSASIVHLPIRFFILCGIITNPLGAHNGGESVALLG